MAMVVVEVVVHVLESWWTENKEQQTGYRLVKTKQKIEGGNRWHTLSQASYECSTYTLGGNRWLCEN
jgi:hypothetical protein